LTKAAEDWGTTHAQTQSIYAYQITMTIHDFWI